MKNPGQTRYVVPLKSSKSHRLDAFAPWTITVSVFSEPNPALSVSFSKCLDCGIRVHTLKGRSETYVDISIPRSSAKSVFMSAGDTLSCDELIVRSVMEK